MQKSHDLTRTVRLRPLEREDLRFVHHLNNNATVMRYWFEEPYETFAELSALFEAHIHEQNERRFIVDADGDSSGLVELVEINTVHRSAEFQIIIAPASQGRGLAVQATRLALDYGFSVLNLHKIYLIVDRENEKAVHVYAKAGFRQEGVLKEEFFMNGQYRDVIRMGIFQRDHLARMQAEPAQEHAAPATVETAVH
ncbi:spermidine N1-acetyltransferase [Herbaspirillum huttiense F1]|uniref:spermidine N1-acetyltransferase n=1 Tax=Herbaspirillum TaxID=963 RepID=UPI00195748AE|nr:MULTISPECIES: spermidine N1-acetyltransferase [Herbaspirillum]MBP1317199.1 diamine N-acetyltransferase [Herbaspirillum sp. 1130]MDR6741573.1 diamine N-acetyltransferase [Herbaspirillum sp. 1173]MDT0357023.1 spermidine N1-acetyltransferase [Herbaspirillum huttiense F1]